MIRPVVQVVRFYIINKGVFTHVPEGKYDFGRQLIPSILGDVYAYVDYSYWSDIGTLVSYYRTNERLAREYAKEIVR